MSIAFPSLGHAEENVSAETLTLHQLRLRDKKTTGLIEADLNSNGRILLPFAHGAQVGIFQQHDGEYRSISTNDIEALCRQGIPQINVTPLEDVMCRLAWLACESHKRGSVQGAGLEAWNQRLRAWQAEKLNGLVDFQSDTVFGFIYIHRGKPMALESAMLSKSGQAAQRLDSFGEIGPWQAKIMEIDPLSMSGRCLVMRRAILQWSRSVFDSYKNIAGEKFLSMMLRELQTQVRPWNWNIRIEPQGVEDNHFFPGSEATAHAYRAILLGIGAQMGFAIGGYLTQRILEEMFNELDQEEREGLGAHHLIPASFS